MELVWRSTRDGRESATEKESSGLQAYSSDTGIKFVILPTLTIHVKAWRLDVFYGDNCDTVTTYRHDDVSALYGIAQGLEDSYWQSLYLV